MDQSLSKNPQPSSGKNRSYPLTLLEKELLKSCSPKNKLLLTRNVNENVIINITSIHKYTLSGYAKCSAGDSEQDEYRKYNKLDFSHGYLRSNHSQIMKSIRFHSGQVIEKPAIPRPPLPMTIISQYMGAAVEVFTRGGFIISGKILAVEKYLTKMNVQEIPLWMFNHALQEIQETDNNPQ